MRAAAEREYGDYVAARAAALVRFAYLICADWHRAEDAVQTALTKLYLVWTSLEQPEAVDAYTRRIVVRVLVDERRLVRFRRERTTGRVPEPAAVPDHATDTGDRLAIRAALARVPARQRAVLVLRYWEDLSVEQTAAALGCSTGTVKSQTARGLQTLRGLLGEPISVQT